MIADLFAVAPLIATDSLKLARTLPPEIVTSLPARLKKVPLPRLLVLCFLLLLLGFGIAPSYLGAATWPWNKQPEIPSAVQKQLKNIQKNGIELADWETVEREEIRIGDRSWSLQALTPKNATTQTEELIEGNVLLLTSPQKWSKDHPAVEWTDINSQQQWTTDRRRQKTFVVEEKATKQRATVNARFMRGWNRVSGSVLQPTPYFFQKWSNAQTFAVLQWYAWPGNGHPSLVHWFWADQLAQWRGYRLPWVAMCILIPTEPLVEDLAPYWPIAESLGQAAQAKLMAGPLQSPQAD